MSLPYGLDQVRTTPGMWLPKVTFDNAVAYILGVDAATEGAVLLGFREWLIVRADDRDNFTWWGLIQLLFFDESTRLIQKTDALSDHRPIIEFMFQCLEEFLSDRWKSNGARVIFLRYQEWLERQEWYDKESPSWVEHNLGRNRSDN